MAGLDRVKKVILILSGKGGVGKSTFSVLLANYLSINDKKVIFNNIKCDIIKILHKINKDYWNTIKVGLLDLDLCGPSIGKMLTSDLKQSTNVNKGSNK